MQLAGSNRCIFWLMSFSCLWTEQSREIIPRMICSVEGTQHLQMSGCLLVCVKDDNIEGIYDTLSSCVMISKTIEGIRLNNHYICATGCRFFSL
jgi:hypothetical protein